MMRAALIALASLTLAGCATNPPIRCPQIVEYTDLEKSVLLGEIDEDGPETQAQIIDYAKLRLACSTATSGK